MNTSEDYEHILTGIEPYRDPFQILFNYEQDSIQYSDAQSRVYEELEIDTDVSTMDRFHVLRMVSQGKPEESFEYLRDHVLEE